MLISKVLIVLTLLSPSFFHIGTDDGLSQLSVLSMAEDAEGAIWVGTSDGLNRIEGKTITVYRHSYQKDDTILDDEVSCLTEDADGGIIACGRYGISIFDRTANRFKSIKTDFPVQCCADIRRITKCPDGDSNYLVYSYNRMLLASNPFRGTTDTISCNFSATALCVCDSVLYVGTNKGLVYQLRCGRNTLEKPSLEYYFDTGLVSSISDILSDDNGRLWIAYPTKGIMSYYPQIDEKRYFCTANGLSSDFVRALEKDDNGIVWAATANNISLIEPVSGSIEILESDNHKPETISSTSIKAIHKAKDGTMWVGSYYGGLDYYDMNAFQSHTLVIPEYHNTHTERVIRSLSTDPDGSIWVGTSRTGIFRYYPSYDKFESFDKLPAGENVLNAVAYHKNGQEVILACEGTGLNVYDKHRNKIIWKGKIPRVFCLAAYDSSRYLVGTMRGLYLFDIEIKQITRVLTKGEKGRVYYVFVDSENDIWIGYDDHLTKGRLIQNDSDDFVFQNEIRRLDIPQVQDIEELNNNLYFASRAGLFKYDRGSDVWDHLNSEKGIHTNLIRGIEIDSYENIWVSTDRSVLSVNPHNLDFREYSVRDGFSNEKYNTYCHCKTSDGTIWFGGIPNICYFKPRGNVLDRLPERPGILGVSINGIPIHGTDRVPRIRSLNNSIVFKLALPKRYSKDKVFYCFEGYDKGWNLLGENDSSVSYSNLPDGEYHLKVKAVNLGGLEALYESGTIRILKPWYNRWWMVAIFALILVSSQILLLLNQKKKSEQAIDFIKSDMSKDIKKARVASYMTIKSLNRERDLEFMEKALEVVNENLSNENFGIDQFAKAMEMSRSNLNIRMKNVYGAPALSLIKRIRIEKAIEYLNKGEKNISEIAYSTGFSSATYFATVFKQITGISPTSWKNKTVN